MQLNMYKSTMYEWQFDDVEFAFDVRQSWDNKKEYTKFEYEYKENCYTTLDSLVMRRWYPKWLNRFIFKSAERKFCRLLSKEIGRKLTYKSALKYK